MFYEKHKIIEFDNNSGNINCKYLVHIKLLLKDNYIRRYFENDQDYQQFLDETKRKSVINSDVNVTVKINNDFIQRAKWHIVKQRKELLLSQK